MLDICVCNWLSLSKAQLLYDKIKLVFQGRGRSSVSLKKILILEYFQQFHILINILLFKFLTRLLFTTKAPPPARDRLTAAPKGFRVTPLLVISLYITFIVFPYPPSLHSISMHIFILRSWKKTRKPHYTYVSYPLKINSPTFQKVTKFYQILFIWIVKSDK